MAEFKLEMKGICKSFPGVKALGQRTAVSSAREPCMR